MFKNNKIKSVITLSCEQRLSPFGKKVLQTLMNQWEKKAHIQSNICQNPLPRSYNNNSKNKRILTFFGNSETPNRTSDLDECFSETVPKTAELIRTVETNEEYDNNNIMFLQAPTNRNQNMFLDIQNDVDLEYVEKHDLNDNGNKNKNINWNNMFDSELLPDKTGHNNSSDQATIFNFEPDIASTNELINDVLITDLKVVDETTKKRKYCTTGDGIKNKLLKNNQLSDITSESIFEAPNTNNRKEKYTKMVKNWLNNIETNRKINKVNSSNEVNSIQKEKDTEIDFVQPVIEVKFNKPNDSTKLFDIVFENKVKTKKKVVQSRLSNKNGVMKYSKPAKPERKSMNDDTALEGNIVGKKISANEPQQNITKESQIPTKVVKKRKIERKAIKLDHTSKEEGKKDNVENKSMKEKTAEAKGAEEDKIEKKIVKEKRVKKFIAPIKSQIPISDVTYKIITMDEDSANVDVAYIRNDVNKTILAVLKFTNGFCQLNNHHTDDTCFPEGIILCIDDIFYFIKGTESTIRDTLKYLFENNKIVCYDGRSILIYLTTQLQMRINSIQMYDAKIGACLLDPDNPPETFSDVQKLVSYTSAYTIATECTLQKAAWYTTLLQECWLKLSGLIMENSLWKVFEDIEMKLLPIIADMELRGVLIDMEKLKSMETVLLSRMKQVEQQCYNAAGKVFQINSTVQVRAILYDELHLDDKCNIKVRETLCRGAKSTSEAMLRSLTSVHPLPRLILEYRHVHKAHATFLAGISQHVKDGVVKPTWEQTGAATGRIASNNPNLQAIPKAPFNLVMFPDAENTASNIITSEPLKFRSVYISPPGYSLLAADFKHIECRVFAHASADASLASILTSDEDLFKVLAARWLKKGEETVTPAERERTKRLVYASLYGAGTRKLMEILNVPYDQATQVAASFNRTFPSLKSFGRSVVTRCTQVGNQLSTGSGRTRQFRDILSADFAARSHAERQAVNFVVQGSAADLCKTAMILTESQLRSASPPLDAQLLLQIHDELVWQVHDLHLEVAAGIIKSAMEGCGHRCGVPVTLPVAISVGKNWADMHEYSVI